MASKKSPHPEREQSEQSKDAQRQSSSLGVLSLDAVRVQVGAGRGEPFRRADMVPLAVMHDRVQPARFERPPVKHR